MPFSTPLPLFMMYFRGWNRLEVRSRHDEFGFGLAATTADPLWALGRQWQLLELKGENAGSPIRVDVAYETALVDQISLGEGNFADLGEIPVEVLVERERVEWDWRLRIRAGQHFERLARQNDLAHLINENRLACRVRLPEEDTEDWINMDYATRRFVSMMEGRAIDGQLLFARIEAGLVPDPIAKDMRDWYAALYSQDTSNADPASPAWKPEQLDFEFRLRGGNPVASGSLHAPSYRNGTVDWHTFVTDGTANDNFQPPITVHQTPVHATYAGQPKARWWEFEDGAVNFGNFDTAKTDIGKLLLAEFGLTQGDDWFVVPLEGKPGTVMAIRKMQVIDCFQVVNEINRARDPSTNPLVVWKAYSLSPQSADGSTADFLYLPPSSGVREESPVVEEVQFALDEDANLMFAIEHVVPNLLGEPSRGLAAHLETRRRWRERLGTDQDTSTTAAPAPDATSNPEEGALAAKIRYMMSTKVARNWIPFVATDAENLAGGQPRRVTRLRQATIVSTEAADTQARISSLSRVLSPTQGPGLELLNEEAVGRMGVRLELRRQRSRSAKGETYVWLGRKIAVGKGESKSGLKFDLTTDHQTT